MPFAMAYLSMTAVAAGGHPLVSEGLGRIALEFPPPGRVATARVASAMDAFGRLSSNKEQHVHVVLAPNEPAVRLWPLLLEGPLSERTGDAAASHAVPSHLDAFAFEDGRYRTGAPVLGLVGDGAAGVLLAGFAAVAALSLPLTLAVAVVARKLPLLRDLL